MSTITDIILITGYDEEGNIQEINNYLSTEYVEQNIQLKRVDDLNIGGKAMQVFIYIIAINYCEIDSLTEFIYGLNWKDKDCLQLFIHLEEWDGFELYTEGN